MPVLHLNLSGVQARMITWAEWKGWKVVEMSNCSGDADIERQLCGACNHICHMMYVEPEGNKNPNRRMCPEHSDFLGDCGELLEPFSMCMAASQERACDMMRSLMYFTTEKIQLPDTNPGTQGQRFST
jgi:hypothetical protein